MLLLYEQQVDAATSRLAVAIAIVTTGCTSQLASDLPERVALATRAACRHAHTQRERTLPIIFCETWKKSVPTSDMEFAVA